MISPGEGLWHLLPPGVSPSTKQVLDRMAELPPAPANMSHLLGLAVKAASAARCAGPDVGTGRRRVTQAREAAALLLLALDRMDADGREVAP